MITNIWRPKLIGIVFLLVILLMVPALTSAQDSDDDEDDATGCNPAMERLAQEMDGIDCSVLVDYQMNGVGLGNIMKAWRLSHDLTAYDGDWESFLSRKLEENLGWGQFKRAERLANELHNSDELLGLKQEGYGWGQLKKALALEEAGIMSFEEALQMTGDELDWDTIQAENGFPPGPPPWAGGGKDKDNAGNGPPPWSNAGGNDKNQNKNKNAGD